MIILVGPSASGKSVVAKKMIEKFGFKKIVTYTTRSKRVNEVDDIDYHFISLEDFLNKKDNDYFIEYAFYNNNYYGTAFNDISSDKILIVEPQGANTYYEKLKKDAFLVYLEASEENRRKRMIERQDAIESIDERLKSDYKYFATSNFSHLDLIIDTNNLDIDAIACIIKDKYEVI